MFQFAIDRGGTFTDVFAKCPNGKVRVLKLLSEDPQNYPDAPTEGIRRIISEESGESMPPGQEVDASKIEFIRMGTTVATNALLERKGERMALLVTEGFRDLLYIGTQARPDIFDLRVRCPDILYEEVVEVRERVYLHNERCEMDFSGKRRIQGITGEIGIVEQELDTEKLRKDLGRIKAQGIQSLAVVLMHSYTFPEHEDLVESIANKFGFSHISRSADVMPMVRAVPRGFTCALDAYLSPCIKRYLSGFRSGFNNKLTENKVLFMQSNGGLVSMSDFQGSKSLLSGPAGGVVGYARTTETQPVIGFDMGGTSTDVSRFAGNFDFSYESTVSGVTVQSPQLDISTVAAGGGSKLFFRNGLFVTGPESAGAHPGPVCYKKGGPLTVTDANLCLGRILPEYFPKIFGQNENEPLDKKGTMAAMDEIASEVNRSLMSTGQRIMSTQEVALGFIKVANETMCRAIRGITQSKGFETNKHTLACFGGAGGQHACAVAKNLSISKIFIHKYSGILSAYGLSLADVVTEKQIPMALVYEEKNFKTIESEFERLLDECKKDLRRYDCSSTSHEVFLNMRYEKTDCALMCKPSKGSPHLKYGDFLDSFRIRYKEEFGFVLTDRKVIIDDMWVRVLSSPEGAEVKNKSGEENGHRKMSAVPESLTQCFFEEGLLETGVYLLEKLQAGVSIAGPAIIIDKTGTMVIEPDCTARITNKGDIEIEVDYPETNKQQLSTELDNIQLSIFSHRFMSIAEQMGKVLQRTSISTNIKERLDFSCALFGPDGGLVSNAPHIPVHLGAMQVAVQYQLNALRGQLRAGDVILTNHPKAGGSHLPDLTVITPVFLENVEDPVFFVANRGHHADIGGITPGSMPTDSQTLEEEGAIFLSFKIVDNFEFQEEKLRELLMAPGKTPRSSGARNVRENIADLQAQIAANNKGIALVTDLITEFGLEGVQAYMNYIQENAELAVTNLLKEVGEKLRGEQESKIVHLSAEDMMDNGSKIVLELDIDVEEGKALFDFSETSSEVYGNTNAPFAVTHSAIIYCLRCMVGHDIPLNQGCLAPVTIKLTKGSFLNPSDDAAVVGGNVLTSQRLCDVILKAFEACAASQGCMNNITFGDDSSGYYETIAGGAGAGPGWNGRSAVHTHMTNTRITDVEILERRYPVIVRRFEVNRGTGGEGRHPGGDGVLRELLFRKNFTLSVLTERRVFRPYGLAGGSSGARGRNTIITKHGRKSDIGPKCTLQVGSGDVLRIESPGGGGYGAP
ncbi:5-oxoprolinase [Galendromus occidentalis]|uniref:5-oxoprolinase n=1 Tax=Galendromus occidentalis TaxID=34638 RepID=A0AAJ7P979_9ACAR|nr:5-oxoprolinase [Galendromus occidentalis]